MFYNNPNTAKAYGDFGPIGSGRPGFDRPGSDRLGPGGFSVSQSIPINARNSGSVGLMGPARPSCFDALAAVGAENENAVAPVVLKKWALENNFKIGGFQPWNSKSAHTALLTKAATMDSRRPAWTAVEHEQYEKVRIKLRQIFPKSDPASFSKADWCGHRYEMLQWRNKLADKKFEEARQAAQRTALEAPLKDTTRYCNTNISAVLGVPTIWCETWMFKPTFARWPCTHECLWEGDLRAERFGRFLPLPREAVDAEIYWKQLPLVGTYGFDEVYHVPTLEDTYFGTEEIYTEDFMTLLNMAVIEAVFSLET